MNYIIYLFGLECDCYDRQTYTAKQPCPIHGYKSVCICHLNITNTDGRVMCPVHTIRII